MDVVQRYWFETESERNDKIVQAAVFFFKQKTAYEIRNCDWSSDVCSSDLPSINGGKWSKRRDIDASGLNVQDIPH